MLVLLALPSAAQVRIGYFSNDAVLRSMPEYIQAQKELDQLRLQYDTETQRAEQEFNTKYEEFLDNLSTLAQSIRRKRQAELQQLMESNVKFREEANRLLRQAEDDAIAPLQQRIDDALKAVATTHQFIIILNTDSNACPYIDSSISEDVSTLITQYLENK